MWENFELSLVNSSSRFVLFLDDFVHLSGVGSRFPASFLSTASRRAVALADNIFGAVSGLSTDFVVVKAKEEVLLLERGNIGKFKSKLLGVEFLAVG